MKKLILIFTLIAINAQAEWEVDFSRRYKDIMKKDKEAPVMEDVIVDEKSSGFLDVILDRQAPIQEIVLMNSEEGFIPNRINLKMGFRYKFNLINVSKKNRNVSFMLDDFSEHHGTYYGERVSFVIDPKKEGIYSFMCPETGAKGNIVVYNATTEPEPPVSIRQPAMIKD